VEHVTNPHDVIRPFYTSISSFLVAVAGFGKDLTEGAEVLDEELGESDNAVAERAYMAVGGHFMVCCRLQGVARELEQTDQCSRCIQVSSSIFHFFDIW